VIDQEIVEKVRETHK